jgi:hypothetical protein
LQLSGVVAAKAFVELGPHHDSPLSNVFQHGAPECGARLCFCFDQAPELALIGIRTVTC